MSYNPYNNFDNNNIRRELPKPTSSGVLGGNGNYESSNRDSYNNSNYMTNNYHQNIRGHTIPNNNNSNNNFSPYQATSNMTQTEYNYQQNLYAQNGPMLYNQQWTNQLNHPPPGAYFGANTGNPSNAYARGYYGKGSSPIYPTVPVSNSSGDSIGQKRTCEFEREVEINKKRTECIDATEKLTETVVKAIELNAAVLHQKSIIEEQEQNIPRLIPFKESNSVNATNKSDTNEVESSEADDNSSSDSSADELSSEDKAKPILDDSDVEADTENNKIVTVPGTNISLITDEDIEKWKKERRKMWLLKISNNKEKHIEDMGIKAEDLKGSNSIFKETKKNKEFIQKINNQVTRTNPKSNLNMKIIQREMLKENSKILDFIKELGDAHLLDYELTESEKLQLFGSVNDQKNRRNDFNWNKGRNSFKNNNQKSPRDAKPRSAKYAKNNEYLF
ncbi:hypothetical protein TPHA_0J02320 [Tetrapisispora phaffii CBS 4417]|uniref:FMR1-interacting protein 1 conserved domain-containing protein n=1 Tax=Tetrapisispora phaffii (strain ATCC 24235 / CBS 4417 / NBRC 1672 / NRRL Y-8282 / UCD 70-5) TaxID=1071381 RepID=G8BYW0_TETPH|nr:hypothetical protein TPHA_0J02320 [Tetrapisispora phaffii CBS 4417]CCE65052.1 hypothetical protein TPHA_0J02320 [Tetrapisispora phaffii CBS 4417]